MNVTKPGSGAGGVLCCQDDVPPFKPKFQYAAKFVCGTNDSDVERVLPGRYATAINIHNPGNETTFLRKKIALTFPPADQRAGKVSQFLFHELGPDEALEVDCEEIPTEFFGGPVAPYVKGFLIVESEESLDVTAVYTAGDLPAGAVSSVQSSDVEKIRERKIK